LGGIALQQIRRTLFRITRRMTRMRTGFVQRYAGFGLAALVVLGAAYLTFDWVMSYRLVRTEADLVPRHPGLMRFAAWKAAGLYQKHCAACHGATMTGDRLRGIPDLTDGDWLYGTGEISEIEDTILYGIRAGTPKSHNLADMPAFAHPHYAREKLDPLSPQEIRDVTDYLFSLEGRKADPKAAARGEAIYTNKGACYDCHTADAKGDHDIGAPDLTDTVWLYGDGSRASLFHSIAEGHAGTCPAWIGRLSPTRIRALAVYIYAKSHPAAKTETP
jgi:cytochrome c oxidase cbb3-type subunit 3